MTRFYHYEIKKVAYSNKTTKGRMVLVSEQTYAKMEKVSEKDVKQRLKLFINEFALQVSAPSENVQPFFRNRKIHDNNRITQFLAIPIGNFVHLCDLVAKTPFANYIDSKTGFGYGINFTTYFDNYREFIEYRFLIHLADE